MTPEERYQDLIDEFLAAEGVEPPAGDLTCPLCHTLPYLPAWPP